MRVFLPSWGWRVAFIGSVVEGTICDLPARCSRRCHLPRRLPGAGACACCVAARCQASVRGRHDELAFRRAAGPVTGSFASRCRNPLRVLGCAAPSSLLQQLKISEPRRASPSRPRRALPRDRGDLHFCCYGSSPCCLSGCRLPQSRMSRHLCRAAHSCFLRPPGPVVGPWLFGLH